MTNWFAENLTWIFSGVGVAALGVIFALIKFVLWRKAMNTTDKNSGNQNISVGGNISAKGDVQIQQIEKNIVAVLTVGVDKKTFNRSQSEYKKDKGREKIQEWGRKLSMSGEWNWHLLGQSLEHYFDAIRMDTDYQHPWTNVAYVYHVIGDAQNTKECLHRSKELAGSGPNYPGRNYKQVEKAIQTNSFLTGGKIQRPKVPSWFIERFSQYLSIK